MKKLSCSSSNCQSQDIVSHLPEEIRCHIISFLSAKDAVRSQTLSKGWKHIWYSSLARFRFDQYNFQEVKPKVSDFRDFVDETLLSHNGSDIPRFHLRIFLDDVFISPRHVNTWISFALRHNVKVLYIHLSSARLERFPSCFFTCNALNDLTLSYIKDLKWPSTFKFPSLKLLSLHDVTFYDENVINKLFSSFVCPVLEELSIYFCNFDDSIHDFSISIHSLKYLQILTEKDFTVNLSIPNVQNIDYECSLPPNIDDENLSSLVKAYFEFHTENVHANYSAGGSTSQILMKIGNMESLDLGYGVSEHFARNSDLSKYLPSSFEKLRYLELTLYPTKNHYQLLTCLLRRSPNLQSLNVGFTETWTSSNLVDMEEKSQPNEMSGGEILKHLRKIKVEDLAGHEYELEIIRFLFENASVVEKIDIIYSYDRIGDSENFTKITTKITEKLSSLCKVSPRAEMIISYS